MRVAIAGGNLQGLEAAYLARRAGWEIVVMDKEGAVPAAGLAHSFFRVNFLTDVAAWRKIIKECDFVIPALEDAVVLDLLQEITAQEGVPLAYDRASYRVSSCKQKSNQLFRSLELPLPEPWPACRFPVLIKPSGLSGSSGVTRVESASELNKLLSRLKQDTHNRWIVEEFVEGHGYSLEILGCGEKFQTLQITEIHVDEAFDCKRVVAPAKLSEKQAEDLKQLTLKTARALNLTGIMDLEAINSKDGWKVLEIDARLPSQTPITVYHSTGINMLEPLYDIFARGILPALKPAKRPKAVIYEQIRVSGETLEILGERVISKVGPLALVENFFGADVALTNYGRGADWVAIVIFYGDSMAELWSRHDDMLESIAKQHDLHIKIDDRAAVTAGKGGGVHL